MRRVLLAVMTALALTATASASKPLLAQTAAAGAAPAPTQPLTKLEAASSIRGSVTVRDQRPCGSVTGISWSGISSSVAVNCSSVAIFRPGKESEQAKGILLETNWEERGQSRSQSVFIDYDEIQDIISGLNYIGDTKGKLKDEKPDNYTVQYSSKGGFQCGYIKYKYQNGDQSNFFMTINTKSYEKATLYPEEHQIKALSEMISNARNDLDKR